MKRTLRHFLLSGLFCIAGFAAVEPALADYAESYKQGVLAADEKRWSDVVRHMEAAIAERPAEGGSSIRLYGTRRVPYLPQFFLGMARFELGDRASALAAFDESARQGVTAAQGASLGYARQLDQYLSSLEAERTRGRVEELFAQGERSLEQARAAASRLTGLRGSNGVRSLLERDPALDRRWKELESSVVAAAGDLQTSRAAGNVEGSRAAVDRAEATLAGLRDLEQKVKAGGTIDIAPAELVDAVRAYFGGRYSVVIDLLAGRSFASRSATLQAKVMLAAARFNQYRSSNQEDAALLAQARAAVAECRSIDPAYRPDARYFSPGFRALFAGGS